MSIKNKVGIRQQITIGYRLDEKDKVSFIDPCCDTIPIDLFCNVMKSLSRVEEEWNKSKDTNDPIEEISKGLDEPLKVGDMCILWNSKKADAVVARIFAIETNYFIGPFKFSSAAGAHRNAIKCESLEQYKEFIKSEEYCRKRLCIPAWSPYRLFIKKDKEQKSNEHR